MAGIKQRRMILDFLDIGTDGAPKFELMGRGFKDLNHSPGAKTASKRYINDASESESIVGYAWTASFEIDQFEDEAVIQYIMDIVENEKTGGDAETDYVCVDMYKSKGADTYEARKRKVAISIDDTENNDGELGASGKLSAMGDWIHGTFNRSTKTFTPETV